MANDSEVHCAASHVEYCKWDSRYYPDDIVFTVEKMRSLTPLDDEVVVMSDSIIEIDYCAGDEFVMTRSREGRPSYRFNGKELPEDLSMRIENGYMFLPGRQTEKNWRDTPHCFLA